VHEYTNKRIKKQRTLLLGHLQKIILPEAETCSKREKGLIPVLFVPWPLPRTTEYTEVLEDSVMKEHIQAPKQRDWFHDIPLKGTV
jgi:hypothetical protein